MDRLLDRHGSGALSGIVHATSSALAYFDAERLEALAEACRDLDRGFDPNGSPNRGEDLFFSPTEADRCSNLGLALDGLLRILDETKNNLRLLRELSVSRDEVEYRSVTGSLWQAHGLD